MSSIVPFEENNLPAHLQNRSGKSGDLTQGIGPGFARMSIKGKIWGVMKGEDRTIVMNPKDPDSPASFVGIVIVAASPDLSRTYYQKAFDDKAAVTQPDCSSADGSAPDAGVPAPQAKTCAACPHAVYGTGQGGKGFRCSNHRRLVIAKPGEYDEEQAMLLNVPGGSLKNLRDYATTLDARKVDYDMVLTKLSFDADEATPKIVFTPVGFLPEEHYNAVQKLAKAPAIMAILGSSEANVQGTADAAASGEAEPAADKGDVGAEDTADAEEAKKKKAAAARKKKAAAAKKKAAEAAAAAAKAAEEAAAAAAEDDDDLLDAGNTETPEAGALGDDLDAMLEDFDE